MAHAHWHLFCCAQRLKRLVDNPDAFLLRLTDKEILMFARMSEEAIKSYVYGGDSLRLRVLHLVLNNRCSK